MEHLSWSVRAMKAAGKKRQKRRGRPRKDRRLSSTEKTASVQKARKNYAVWRIAMTEMHQMKAAVSRLDLRDRESEHLRQAAAAPLEVVLNCVVLYIGQRMWKRCGKSISIQEQARACSEFMAELIDDVEKNYLLIEERIEREKLSDTP